MHKGDNKDDDDDYDYVNNDNKCNLYCLHPVVLYDEALNKVISFWFAQQYIYCIILSCKHNNYNSKWFPSMTCFDLCRSSSGYCKM